LRRITPKSKFCDSDHIEVVHSAVLFKSEETAMRQALSLAVIVTLLIVTIVEVVAAGGRSVLTRNHLYYATPNSGISVAVPSSMKSFPTELLPQ
jgi:hypothetical protein